MGTRLQDEQRRMVDAYEDGWSAGLERGFNAAQEITDEMVQRAAHAIQEVESAADATAYNTGSWFFDAARAALTVAFRKERHDG
jgi:flagellar biosynthesis/type III secretory pathway protein FliH